MNTVSAIVSISAVAAGFIAWFVRKGIPAARKFWRAVDQLVGVPAEGRRAAQPGLFERMDAQDAALEDQSAVLEKIRHEVEFNDGSSVKDAVNRIEKRLDDHMTPQTTTINVNPAP
jgi:hypothetical protein